VCANKIIEILIEMYCHKKRFCEGI